MIENGKILQQRYRIDKQIGQGGMGAVYVATDERFGSTVAIKETLFMDDSYRKAIEREARLLNSLKHTALPRVSDHFLEENVQFLVMEYIPGEDLYAMLERSGQPFSVEEVLKWADQLLDALDFLHNQENPVIHRDIKPQNLKIAASGQIILLDFGLAKGNPTDAGHQTAAKSIFGYSRNYASLEQIQGTGTDPRSDLYSLGATLYHLATGQPPEDALTRAMSVLSQQADPMFPAHRLRSEIPVGLSGILQNALDLNSSARPQSAVQMRQMLGEYHKFEHLAVEGDYAKKVVNDSLPEQKTRLMPGITRKASDRQTGVATEVLPVYISEETSLRTISSDGKSQAGTSESAAGRKKLAFAAVSLSALLLAGSVGAGVYLYEPAFFGSGNAAESNLEQTVPENIAEPITPANIISETAAETPETTGVSATNEEPMATAKPTSRIVNPQETVRKIKPISEKKGEGSNADSEEVKIDGDTIYVGNMKIKNGRLEVPNTMIEDGVDAPEMRKMSPGPLFPPDFKGLTPIQRRKLQMIQRRQNEILQQRGNPPKKTKN